MKVNFDNKFYDPLAEGPLTEADVVLSLGRVAVRALMAADSREEMSGDLKLSDYALGMKVRAGGEVELTAEEAARIKARIAKFFGPAVVGQAWPWLDGKE